MQLTLVVALSIKHATAKIHIGISIHRRWHSSVTEESEYWNVVPKAL